MGIIDRLEDEYVSFSSERTSLRDLLELVAGSALFVLVAVGATWLLVDRTVARWVGAILVVIFVVTIASQAYWAVAGREDYEE